MVFRIALALLAALAVLPSHAQLFRAYLSASGNDANPCTLPAPCRLIPAALAATAAGGEIWMLDAANYNTTQVAIDKAINIRSMPGVVGSFIAPPGLAAINVSAAVNVSLRGVNVAQGPSGGGQIGITATVPGVTLTLEDCTVIGMANSGVNIAGAGSSARIVGTTFRDNVIAGVTASAAARVAIHGSRFLGNGIGVQSNSVAPPATDVTITDSSFFGGASGISAQAAGAFGATARISASGVVIQGTTTAVLSQAAASSTNTVVYLTRSTIANNGASHSTAGAIGGSSTLLSMGDNFIENNGSTSAIGTFSPR